MRVRRGAGAEEAERRLRMDGVPGARREKDGVAWENGARLAVDVYGSMPVEDEVDLFSALMVMPLGEVAGGQAGFGQALVLHGRIGPVENAANGGAIRGGEGRLSIQIANFHWIKR